MNHNQLFNQQDIEQIRSKGITLDAVSEQINHFSNGFPALNVTAAATINNGIKKYDDATVQQWIAGFEKQLPSLTGLKFVPASGAATRMFKELFDFVNSFKTDDTFAQSQQEIKKEVKIFFDHLGQFAFYDDLSAVCQKQGYDLNRLLNEKKYVTLLRLFLNSEGLNYGSLPKALLLFHRYSDHIRTAIEEHLIEGAEYCKCKDGIVPIHFTCSEEHQRSFELLIAKVQPWYEKKYNVRYQITFSQQEPSTDTLAVDMNNQPFRDNDGRLVFRPGGHGALLSNLNRFGCDVLFIKNIDNITTDKYNNTTFRYKKVLGGVLLHYCQKIFSYLRQIDSGAGISLVSELDRFLRDELCIIPPDKFTGYTEDEKLSYFYTKLNRPIRICGMVKNEGDTGGGPFWTRNSDGTVSLQIAETSQLNLTDEKVKTIFTSATHFNPADFALCTNDYKGNKFDLMKYRDADTGFISKKSKDGRDLKALELPGLWNGSMSDWITIFVDVPLITFNPVKSVNDLLKQEHAG